MEFNKIIVKEELEQFVNEMVGEGKECEKNLFTALYLFLKNFGTTTELDLEHILALVLATKVPKGQRNPSSDIDKLFEQVAVVDSKASCLIYYNAYKLYPEGMQNQAAGNLAYKICAYFENWPNLTGTNQVSARDVEVRDKVDKQFNETHKDEFFM